MKKFKEYKVGKLTFIDRKGMTPEQWRSYRFQGIGGSDVSSILDLNPYATITELFYEKIGYRNPEDLSKNEAVLWGEVDESELLNMAQYYDYNSKDRLDYIVNFREGKKVRNIVRLNYIIKHEDYPFLIINPDGVEVDKSFSQDQVDQAIQKLGKLPKIYTIEETKTISGMTADTWEQGVPLGYVSQVGTYQIPFKDQNDGMSGNIWSKKDGRIFEGHPIPWSDDLYKIIITQCEEFWETCKEGRSILKLGHNVSVTEHLLDNIAPTPKSATPAYEKYLNQRLKLKKEKTIVCPEEIFEKAVKYKKFKKAENEQKKEAQIISTEIKEFMLINDVLVLDCGENGRISFSDKLSVNIKQ